MAHICKLVGCVDLMTCPADGIDDASRPSSLQGMAAELNQKTEAALAGSQDPQDSMTLLEDIASLSKQMVGEAKEDVELFNRASSTSSQ